MVSAKCTLSAIALVAMTGVSMAATSLCVEDVSSGLNWEAGEWRLANFRTKQYMIRSVSPYDDVGSRCGSDLRQYDLPEEPVDKGGYSEWYACYGMAEVGVDLTEADVTYCRIAGHSNGTVWSVNCDDQPLWSLYFQPTGELQVTRSAEARVNFGGDEGPRATMSVAAGKCTAVEQ